MKLRYSGVLTQAEWQHGSLMDLVVLPLVPYLLWAIAYYVKVCS
jgi:hypothetical protein